jgi:hypothetical protein
VVKMFWVFHLVSSRKFDGKQTIFFHWGFSRNFWIFQYIQYYTAEWDDQILFAAANASTTTSYRSELARGKV